LGRRFFTRSTAGIVDAFGVAGAAAAEADEDEGSVGALDVPAAAARASCSPLCTSPADASVFQHGALSSSPRSPIDAYE
jgi:hypothetical protein